MRAIHELDLNIKVREIKPLPGACTNSVHWLQDISGREYVLKTGASLENVYAIEAKSLAALGEISAIRVPIVKSSSNTHLLMEYIPPGSYNANALAQGIKALHQVQRSKCGLSYNTYLGHFLQDNHTLNWPEFFWQQRLLPLVKLCKSKGYCDAELDTLLTNLSHNIARYLGDVETFSLLHGDLWSGNYFFDQKNSLVLIDPAIYFGDPRCDLAMFALFGGGSTQAFNIDENSAAIRIYKAYYLLYHLYDCGMSYLEQTKSVLRFLN